jgi:hypothetical protein
MTKKLEVSGLTGEIIEIELKGEELKQYLTDQKIEAKRLADIETDKIAKATAKAAAEGKLAALGLTTDDLRALGL